MENSLESGFQGEQEFAEFADRVELGRSRSGNLNQHSIFNLLSTNAFSFWQIPTYPFGLNLKLLSLTMDPSLTQRVLRQLSVSIFAFYWRLVSTSVSQHPQKSHS